MKTPVGTNSACWFCAVLDILSALSLPHPPTPREEGTVLWRESRRLAAARPERRRDADRRRYGRSLGPVHHSERRFALYQGPHAEDGDLEASRALAFIDRYQRDPTPNCSRESIYIGDYTFRSEYFYTPFGEQVAKAVQLANVLNSLFMYSYRSDDLYKNVTFFALTQTLVEDDPKVKGCGIAFRAGQYPLYPNDSKSYFFPYSYRADGGTTVVSDLTKLYSPFQMPWFTYHKDRFSSSSAGTYKHARTVFTNFSDVGKLSNIQHQWNVSIRVFDKDGYWGRPYYDCLLNTWILQFSVPFFGLNSNGHVVFKGVVLLDLDLSLLEINQCATKESGLFAGTHRCREESTRCVHLPGNEFRWGSYECHCKAGFYSPGPKGHNNRVFDGRQVEMAYLEMVDNISLNYTQDFMCLPCRKGCSQCEEDEPCIVEYDVWLRGIPLGIQSFTMTITLVVGIVVARLRKTKVMRSSVWVLLEMVLLGALLLYATVVIQYFEPDEMNCLLVPWFREVGFAILYGTLLLKIYRILAEFQSRKAHRVHVRDKDLFKSLAVILVVVLGYMAAWTAVNADHLAQNSTLLQTAVTADNLSYVLCKFLWWDYAIEMAEALFLGVGVYMCYCVRAAPSDYSEGRYVTVAIAYELFVSVAFYVVKHLWWLELHPDYFFLLYFLRCQATVTINLLILLGPKLWYAHRPPEDDRMRTRAYSQSDVQDSTAPETMKLNVGISSNGDVDVGEISLTEMDPEDIRAELKRLYTQLQIYKTKTMRKDNPHISKRRGGRKQTHRRFSLQAFHHKHRHHHEHEHEHEMSKTPEESTNSAEAMTFPMEPSVKEEPEGSSGSGARNVPSVSFKPGHT